MSQRRSRSVISGGRSFCGKKTSRQLWTETSRESGLVVERKDFVQERTQPSDHLDVYRNSGHQHPPQDRAQQLTGLCGFSSWLGRCFRKAGGARRGQHRLLGITGQLIGLSEQNPPVTCGKYMLIDARTRWARSQVPNFESFTCARFESSGRSRGGNSTKRTQTTDTHHCQTVIFAQKFRPTAKRAPPGRATR